MDIIPKALCSHVLQRPEITSTWQIANQLQNCDGCSDRSQRAEPSTRQLFSKGVAK